MGQLDDFHDRIEHFIAEGNNAAVSALCATTRNLHKDDPLSTYYQGLVAFKNGLTDPGLFLMERSFDSGIFDYEKLLSFSILLQENGRFIDSEKYLSVYVNANEKDISAAHRAIILSARLGSLFFNMNETLISYSYFQKSLDLATRHSINEEDISKIYFGFWASAAHCGVSDACAKKVTDHLIEKYGHVVIDGFLKGMKLWDDRKHIIPYYMIGSYEHELTGVFQDIIEDGSYSHVIDVGAHYGYYAVGLALKMKGARITAFEMEEPSRKVCLNLARINAVEDRFSLKGACTPEGLRAALDREERCFILMDCEGYEGTLVDLDSIPALAAVDLLIESHDFSHAGMTETLIGRLKDTHDIAVLNPALNDPEKYPALQDFSVSEKWLAISEFRPQGIKWIRAKSRTYAMKR